MTRLDGDWGTVPKDGTPANISGTWGGVVGDVLNGYHHMAVAGWINNYERRQPFLFLLLCNPETDLSSTYYTVDV